MLLQGLEPGLGTAAQVVEVEAQLHGAIGLQAPQPFPQQHGGDIRYSPRSQAIIGVAQNEARRLQDEFVSTEHLFLALAAETGRAPGAQLLQRLGVTKDALYTALTSHPMVKVVL